jgi:hypothetical protein
MILFRLDTKLPTHLIIVVLMSEVRERLLTYLFQFFLALIDGTHCDIRHVRFVQEEPLGVTSFEDLKVVVKVSLERLKFTFRHALLLDVISRVYQVVEDLLADSLRLLISVFSHELLNFVTFREARPHDHFELTHVQQL